MSKLIEEAKKTHTGRGIKSPLTVEDLELATAWAKGEISNAQIVKVKGLRPGVAIYVYLCMCFKEVYKTK